MFRPLHEKFILILLLSFLFKNYRDKDVDIRIVKDYVAPKALKLVCAGGKVRIQ